MSSFTAVQKARPPAVDVPDTVATDDNEGNTGANSLLAGEALHMLGHSQTATSSSLEPRDLQDQDTVLTIPDTFDASSYGPNLSISQSPQHGIDEQPLLQWRQQSPSPPRLQRRRSELLLASARVNAGSHRSTSETSNDASIYHTAGSSSSSSSNPQPFYGVEPRRGPRRDASSQLLRSMPAPYRQRSLLSRGSPPLLQAQRRRNSSEYEAAHSPRMPEMIEMISNPLSRINSDGPESSGGSYLVELSPDSYEPLQSVIQDTEPLVSQLPVMPEEELEVRLSL